MAYRPPEVDLFDQRRRDHVWFSVGTDFGDACRQIILRHTGSGMNIPDMEYLADSVLMAPEPVLRALILSHDTPDEQLLDALDAIVWEMKELVVDLIDKKEEQ